MRHIYLRVFYLTSVGFGIYTTIMLSLLTGFPTGFLGGLLAAICFGICMSLVAGSLHKARLIRINNGKPPISFDVQQMREILVHIPFEQCIEKIHAFLSLSSNMRIQTMDLQNGIIVARTTTSWLSWGETVEIVLREVATSTTSIRVTSQPSWKLTAVDYGKNLENVNKLAAYLQGPWAG